MQIIVPYTRKCCIERLMIILLILIVLPIKQKYFHSIRHSSFCKPSSTDCVMLGKFNKSDVLQTLIFIHCIVLSHNVSPPWYSIIYVLYIGLGFWCPNKSFISHNASNVHIYLTLYLNLAFI